MAADPASRGRTTLAFRIRTWLQSPPAIALGFLVLAFGGPALYVTQPLAWTPHPVATATRADPSRLRAHVSALCSQFGSRDWRHTPSLDSAAQYLRQELERSGGRVEEQVFGVRGRTYRNVIARFGPLQGERIILGAHYDTCNGLPGADDNTSGVAGLLELGRLLGTDPPKVPVELVAYTLEEPPFFRTQDMGSARHAESLRRQGHPVGLMVSIEMIGSFSDAAGSQHFPLPGVGLLYPSKGNFIAVVGAVGDGMRVRRVKAGMSTHCEVPIHSMNAPRSLAGVDYSDHGSYWDRGFPAVMVTDTAFFRNPRYHTPRDTPDTLDYPRMAQVVQGLKSIVEAQFPN